MTDKKKIITAGLWIIVIYGLSQLLRLGSNLIITRLLVPEMFGIMAIVQIVIRGIEMFSDLGLWAFIVRHKNGTDKHIVDTVWTIQVIRGWAMFLAILCLAVLFLIIKNHFQLNLKGVFAEEILPYLLIVSAVTAVFNGFKSMAPAIMSRDLKRGKLELIELFSQFVGIAVMITWALTAPSIWALVSAGIVSSIMNVILTYTVFPFRHQFSWNKSVVKEVYNFGKWIFLASALTYIAYQGDRLFFGIYISPAQLGIYGIAFMLASTFIALAQQIVFKVWFPVLSKTANENKSLLKSKYYKIRTINDTALFLISGALIALAPIIINILYDSRYHEAGWMLQILAISLIGEALAMVGTESLSALGITKYRVKIMLVKAIFLLAGLPIIFNYFGFIGAIYWTAINTFFALPVLYYELYKNKLLNFFKEIRWLPIVFLGYWIGKLISEQLIKLFPLNIIVT